MKRYKPTDATTNPSLILQASEKPKYSQLIDQAVAYAKGATRLVLSGKQWVLPERR